MYAYMHIKFALAVCKLKHYIYIYEHLSVFVGIYYDINGPFIILYSSQEHKVGVLWVIKETLMQCTNVHRKFNYFVQKKQNSETNIYDNDIIVHLE